MFHNNYKGCDIYVILGGLFGFVNISTLTFMSVERYLMIKSPLLVLKISSRCVFACIALTWLYSLACVLPQLVVLEHGFVLEGLLTSCTFNYLDRTSPAQTLLMMLMFVFGFFVPLALIIVFYLLMWHFLRNNNVFLTYNVRYPTSIRKEDHHENDDSPTLLKKNMSIAPPRKPSQASGLQQLRREIRVARMIFLIVAAFVLAWLPYALVTLFAQFAPVAWLPRYVTPFTTSLPALFAKLSSVYNPLLYTLTNSECRAYYKRLLVKKIFKPVCCFVCCCCPRGRDEKEKLRPTTTTLITVTSPSPAKKSSIVDPCQLHTSALYSSVRSNY